MSVALITDSWRRPNCSRGCWQSRVKLSGEQAWRTLVFHDVDAHESAVRIEQATTPLVFGRLTINLHSMTAVLDGRVLRLTATEFTLLRYLATRAGEVCTYSELLANIWGDAYAEEPSHLIRVNVARLRSKLGPAAGLVQTRFDVGLTMPRPESVSLTSFPPRSLLVERHWDAPLQRQLREILSGKPGVWHGVDDMLETARANVPGRTRPIIRRALQRMALADPSIRLDWDDDERIAAARYIEPAP